MKLGRGTVVVELDPTKGHEQHGVRPCVVVSDPDIGTPGQGLLYPALAAGQSGLAKKSFASIDHLRSVDKRRITRVFGELAREEIVAIDEGLAVFLGWGGCTGRASRSSDGGAVLLPETDLPEYASSENNNVDHLVGK